MAGMNPELAMYPPTPFAIASPFSQSFGPSTSAANRPNHKKTRAASFSFRPRKPSQHSPELRKSSLERPIAATPLTGQSEIPPNYAAATQASSMSSPAMNPPPLATPAVSPPSLIKSATTLRHKPSFSLFGHPAHDTPSVPKAKRNRLVRRKYSEPAFDIVTPSRPQAKESTADEQIQHEAQMAGEAPSTTHELEDTSATAIATSPKPEQLDAVQESPADKDFSMALSNPEKEDSDNSPITNNTPPPKRWSRAPLLPELDFGLTPTASQPLLFNPTTHQTPPEAKINLSTLPLPAGKTLPNLASTSTSPANKPTYRCDVHASDSASQLAIEHACQTLVRSAGGTILDSYFYPGGFLYALPPGIREPIGTGEIALPAPGARITVENCVRFGEPRFDGLRMHPVGVGGGGMAGEGLRRRSAGLVGKLSKRRKMENLRVQEWVKQSAEGVKGELVGKEGEEVAAGEREGTDETAHGAGAGIGKKQSLKSIPENGGISLSSIKSFGRLRCHGSEEADLGSSKPALATPRSTQSFQGGNEKRFAIVAASSVSDEESGAEEWESVQSELYD